MEAATVDAAIKTMKLFILTIFAMLSLAAVSFGQAADVVTVRTGKTVKGKTSKVSVKLVEVTEDSRCPEGTQCVWAGNAKVRLAVSGIHGTKIIELNTGMEPRSARYESFSVSIVSLTPHPKAGVTLDRSGYTAEIKIQKLAR